MARNVIEDTTIQAIQYYDVEEEDGEKRVRKDKVSDQTAKVTGNVGKSTTNRRDNRSIMLDARDKGKVEEKNGVKER